MAELKVGDSFPSGVTFSYVPYTPENGDITACGIPINYDASKGSYHYLAAPNDDGLFQSFSWLSAPYRRLPLFELLAPRRTSILPSTSAISTNYL
jgi:hypothetical protein